MFDAPSAQPGVEPILWSIPTDGADGMAFTPDSIIVVASEVISAFDRATGKYVWSSEMSPTNGPTPVTITADGIIVVAPEYEGAGAFDVATGEEVSIPTDVSLPSLPTPQPRLPNGYAIGSEGLTYNGRVIWSEPRTSIATDDPFVARHGDLTVINDFDFGVRIVDDDGTVLAAPPMGSRSFSQGPVYIDGDVALTVAPDGTMYAIGQAAS